VESCTAIVEHYDGTMEVLHYPSIVRARAAREEVSAGPRPDGARAVA
jgi:hypothetical protein